MKKNEMEIVKLYDLEHTLAKPLLEKFTYPWEALPEIGAFVELLGASLPAGEYANPMKGLWIHKTAKVAPTAGIIAPAIIGAGAEIRHGAYIRGNVLIGADVVVGNSSELKNVILFDKAQVPHYNYAGDSILGYKAHMGAGAITSNVKSDKTPVKVHAEDGDIETGLKKVGAMIGDGVEIGCSSVLNPGTVVGRDSNIYPLSSVRGCISEKSIYKKQGEIAEKNTI